MRSNFKNSSLASKQKNPSLLANKKKSTDLRDRIIFTLLMLIVYRIGTYIPLPGIDPETLKAFSDKNQGGVLGMFNMFSGGALGRMTIFSLNVMPYITASIIIQLLTITSKRLEELKKEGERGRRQINQYTRYLTVFLTIFQGYALASGLERVNIDGRNLVVEGGMFFKIITVSTLVGSTMFLVWLGEQITNRGIGNGISLIIFTGIVAALPSALLNTVELGRTGALSTIFIIIVLLAAIGLIALIVFIERSHRKITVQYPKRQVGNKMYAGDSSYIPLKINTAGVIPPIFASSLLLFPATLYGLSNSNSGGIMQTIAGALSHGKPLYIILYVALITLFCFFYTAVVFNSNDTAENIKKYGGFIPGIRPGKNTAEYFDDILTKLTVIGAIYLAGVCVLPEILIAKYSLPFYLGGTSLLIVVNVAMDSVNQVQTHLLSQRYESLLKKSKIGK